MFDSNQTLSPDFRPTLTDRIKNRFFYSKTATGVTIVAGFFLAVVFVYLSSAGALLTLFSGPMPRPAMKRAGPAGALSLKSGG